MSTDDANIRSRRQKVSFSKVALITLVFAGSYFGLRALPDAECGFLHYEEVVGPDGTVEFCATNHASFLDLTRLDYPLEIARKTVEPFEGGKQVTMLLETHGGMPIEPHELAVTHTKKMHVLVIDGSLEDYHHVHPEPVGRDGNYRFHFTPQRTGEYRVFTEIVPLRTRRQLIASSVLPIEGTCEEPVFARSENFVSEGIQFELEGVPREMRTGRDYRFRLNLSGVDGQVVELEEIMGAKGHMVAFDAERRGFAHMHPIASVLGKEDEDELSFLFNVPNPGWYRLFAQVQVDGQEVYGRFDLKVN